MGTPDRAGHVHAALRMIGELGPVTSGELVRANANMRRYLPMLSNACWIEAVTGGWSLTPEGQRMLKLHNARKP